MNDQSQHTTQSLPVPPTQTTHWDVAAATELPVGEMHRLMQPPEVLSEQGNSQNNILIDQLQMPKVPFSGGNKEYSPVGNQKKENIVQLSDVEPVLHPDLQEAGVEQSPNHEQPKLDASHKAVGIEPAKETVPVLTIPSGLLHLPKTQAEALEIKQSKIPVTESIRWLAELVLKQFKIARLHLASN